MKKCSICGETARFEVLRRPTSVPLVVFGRRLEDPVYTCEEHGSHLSKAGASLQRLGGRDGPSPAPVTAVLLLGLLCCLGGCVGFDWGGAVDGVLPDRFGVGHQWGYLEGVDDPELFPEPDRDIRLTNLYVEWDLPQVVHEPPRRRKEEAQIVNDLLLAVLNELRAGKEPPPRDDS